MTASLAGAVEGEYRGTGEFSYGTPYPGGKSAELSSRGEGSQHNESFYFRTFGTSRPDVGTYRLAPRVLEGRQETGTFAIYSRTLPDGTFERYMSLSGSVVITRSQRDGLEGEFEFTGVRYEQLEPIRPDAPRITVTGTFAAVPANQTVRPSLP
jgi:hypothetical protein